MKLTVILIIAAELFITAGQICLKKSSDLLSLEKTTPIRWIAGLFLGIGRMPVLAIGIAAMLTGLLFWFAALSRGELSFVCLLGSIQYIFALLAAHFFLGEKISASKLLGTLLITLGIVLTIMSSKGL